MKSFLTKASLAVMLATPFSSYANPADDAEGEFNFTDVEITATNHTGIYPFVPFEVSYIQDRARVFAEDPNAVINMYEMNRRGLLRDRFTSEQPWTGNVWGLNKGIIADPYRGRVPMNPLYAHRELSWQGNHLRLTQRIDSHHNRWRRLNQRKLNRMAPSEKYDLLLGDDNFSLTAALRDYLYTTAVERSNGFVTALHTVGGNSLNWARELVQDRDNDIDSLEDAIPYAVRNRGGIADQMALESFENGQYASFEEALSAAMIPATREAQNYVLRGETVPQVALWEGICNGWASAAGKLPRPATTVSFDLPNGKKLNFYPTDIKALASLMFNNSVIMDTYFGDDPEVIGLGEGRVAAGTLFEGYRCWTKEVGRDPWGRRIDILPNEFTGQMQPACIGVHPALFHLAMVNLIGVQGRSFLADKQVKSAVWNYPLSGYGLEFFNPLNGEYGSFENSVVAASARDQFRPFRSSETRSIVGVKMTMHFIGTDLYPNRKETDSPSDDRTRRRRMLYDLELDAEGNIVGGQWRATEVGAPNRRNGGNHHQPDFIWSISKNWKSFFPVNNSLSEWRGNSLPGEDWLEASYWSTNRTYNETYDIGWNNRCDVEHQVTGEVISVGCEHQKAKPVPMVDVVKGLLDRSAGSSW